jgi:SPOR domain
VPAHQPDMSYRRAACRIGPVALVVLSLIAGCSRERDDWRSAQAADTVAAYEVFLRDYPSSPHSNAATQRIAQLAEDEAWQLTLGRDDVPAYETFLSRFPAGNWASEARLRREGLLLPAPEAPPSEPVAGPLPQALPDAAPRQPGRIQLGAFSGVSQAEAGWVTLRAAHPQLLGGLAHRVEAVEASGRRLFRLQALLESDSAALDRCDRLRARGQPCLALPAR